MQVNSVHKMVDDNRQPSLQCYINLTIASVALLGLAWIQLDIAESIRYFFATILNSVQ